MNDKDKLDAIQRICDYWMLSEEPDSDEAIGNIIEILNAQE